MCKGIAILINDRKIVMNEKTNSHSELQLKNEDSFLKINCIYDDSTEEGYRFEIDNHNISQLEEYKKEGFVDDKNQIIDSYKKRLYAFAKEKENKFFKLFSKYLQSATIEGNQYNDSATIEGNQYNDSATIKGFQYNYSATIEGNQYNNSATIKGDIIIYKMKNGDKKTQELLDKFSEENKGDYTKATFNNFVKWLLKNRIKEWYKLEDIKLFVSCVIEKQEIKI